MSVYFKDGQAFVEVHDGYLMCIGTREEVEGASEEKVMDLIRQAMMWKRFHEMDSAKGQTLQ